MCLQMADMLKWNFQIVGLKTLLEEILHRVRRVELGNRDIESEA